MFLILKKLKLIKHIFSRGFFIQSGWLNSYYSDFSCDFLGEPIPWYSYSAVSFLKERLKNNFSIFEFGCGASTLFFSKLVGSVISVEHREVWYKKIIGLKLKNTNIILVNKENYSSLIELQKQKFDVILVDSLDRIRCVKKSIPKIKQSGVIILDDAERPQYKRIFNYMTKQGFKYIKFTGLGPIKLYQKTTAIFYKSNNCLGI